MHGYGGNALSHINYTNFKNIADREGFYLIYPQGLKSYHLILEVSHIGMLVVGQAKAQ